MERPEESAGPPEGSGGPHRPGADAPGSLPGGETRESEVRRTEPVALAPGRGDRSGHTRQNWRGPKAGAGKEADGLWLVDVEKETKFDVTLRFMAPGRRCKLVYGYCGKSVEAEVAEDATLLTLRGVVHPAVLTS